MDNLARIEQKLDRIIALLEQEGEIIGGQRRLIGWKQIIRYFPFSLATLYRRGYHHEMLEAGYVMKTMIATDPKKPWQKHTKVWAFEFMILSFITAKQAKQGYV